MGNIEAHAAVWLIVGLLAFALVVCVTVLCRRIRLLDREETEKHRGREDGDGRAF